MELKQDWLFLGKHVSPVRLETEFRYQEDGDLKSLIDRGHVDTLLSTAEGGLVGPAPTSLLSSELGVSEAELYRWANKISEDREIQIVALRSRLTSSRLNGVLLIPFSRAESYRHLVKPEHRGTPYRDFFYNVTYEAIAYASQHWDASRLALNHLYACNKPFHVDVALCQCEALIHKVDESPSTVVRSLCFLGCVHVQAKTFEGFGSRLSALRGTHRPIGKNVVELKGGVGHIITLNWSDEKNTVPSQNWSLRAPDTSKMPIGSSRRLQVRTGTYAKVLRKNRSGVTLRFDTIGSGG